MKTLTLTQARRQLGELVRSHETVEVTHRGEAIGTLRGGAGAQGEAPCDRDRAMAAARRLREIGLKYKPSKKHGGTRALRQLRDHGE